MEEIINRVSLYNAATDQSKIRHACDLNDAPDLELLDILMPLKPDDDTVIALLLLSLYLEEKLDLVKTRELFGSGVVGILDGVGRLEGVKYSKNDKSSQLEILRKMFFAMAKDLRVVLVALSWRLHKLRKIKNLVDEERRMLFAMESLEIYVPIAARLGVYKIKTEMEDLAFEYADPAGYSQIHNQLIQFGDGRNIAVALIVEELKKFLSDKGFSGFDITGRLKSVYSIYKKLRRKNFISVDQLHDIFAIRIIVPSKYDEHEHELVDYLYGVLGMIHSQWRPISRRFKDYIAVPKPNGYRSLHTVVLGLAPKDMNQPVEIQIRSADMHDEAEYGISAHWLYKGKRGGDAKALIENQIEWLRGLDRIRSDLGGDSEVMSDIGLDIFEDRIFILTPRGEVKDLPSGATPLDFAYLLHTDIGHRCTLAKVNGTAVPLDYELNNGDLVEIVTGNSFAPKLKWLSIVKTNQAKAKIKAWFRKMNRDHNLKEGRKLLNDQLQRLGKPILDQRLSILKEYGGKRLTVAQRESIISEVGQGAKLASDVIRNVYPYEEIMQRKPEVSLKKPVGSGGDHVIEEQILVGGEDGLPIKLAACCKPAVGDKIIAYVTRGNRLTIHKGACSLLNGLDEERIVEADWKGMGEDLDVFKYRVGVRLKAVARVDLLKDLTSVLSNLGVYVVDMKIQTLNGRIQSVYFLLDLEDLDKFDVLLDRMENVDGVLQITRED